MGLSGVRGGEGVGGERAVAMQLTVQADHSLPLLPYSPTCLQLMVLCKGDSSVFSVT